MWEKQSQQNVVYETRLGGGNIMNSLSEWDQSARNNPDLQAVVDVSEVISMEDIIFIGEYFTFKLTPEATGAKLVDRTQREENIRNAIRHHTAGLPLNVLVTGRYGSGKSRTINSMLNVLLNSNLQYTYYIPETGEHITERYLEYDSKEYNLVFYDTMGIDQTLLTNNENNWINMAMRGRLQPNVDLTSRKNYISWFQQDIVAKKIDVILHVMQTSKMDEHLEIRKQIVQLAKPYQVQVVSVFTNSNSSDETKNKLTNFPQLDPKHTYFIENDELLASVEERVEVLRLMEFLCRQGATRNLKKNETEDPNVPVSFGEESSSCCVM
jgi:hypothetical protein